MQSARVIFSPTSQFGECNTHVEIGATWGWNMSSAVGWLNNCLPLFPTGSETDKFSTLEIVELLEWTIPKSWSTACGCRESI